MLLVCANKRLKQDLSCILENKEKLNRAVVCLTLIQALSTPITLHSIIKQNFQGSTAASTRLWPMELEFLTLSRLGN